MVCGSGGLFVLGGLSGGGVCDSQSICLWFLVNGGDYFVCGVYGEGSSKTPVTVFLVSATIPLIPGAALYRTMNWMMMKDWAEFSEGRDLYDPFCGEHGCRYDVDDHCFSDGLAVDVQAETDVSV